MCPSFFCVCVCGFVPLAHLQNDEVAVDGTLSKRVVARVASDADELVTVSDHPHTSQFPRLPQFLLAVCKRAVCVRAFSPDVMMAQLHLEGEALVPHVTRLSAPEADEIVSVRLH